MLPLPRRRAFALLVNASPHTHVSRAAAFTRLCFTYATCSAVLPATFATAGWDAPGTRTTCGFVVRFSSAAPALPHVRTWWLPCGCLTVACTRAVRFRRTFYSATVRTPPLRTPAHAITTVWASALPAVDAFCFHYRRGSHCYTTWTRESGRRTGGHVKAAIRTASAHVQLGQLRDGEELAESLAKAAGTLKTLCVAQQADSL